MHYISYTSLPPPSAAGISRSVTITVMYLMTVSSFSFEESLTVVQYCREMANPNYGFRLQLKRFEEDCLAEVRGQTKCRTRAWVYRVVTQGEQNNVDFSCIAPFSEECICMVKVVNAVDFKRS